LKRRPYVAEIAEVVAADFPIEDAWQYFPMESPLEGVKKDISGRFPGGISRDEPKWDASRIVHLPVYVKKEIPTETLTRSEFPSDKPFMAIASRVSGYYNDERMAQAISVLLVWQDQSARVLELNWAEGPLIDCISPEWYILTSPRLTLKEAVKRLERSVRHPGWTKCSFWLYFVPPGLGDQMLGKGEEVSSKIWQLKWKYDKHEEMMRALYKIELQSGLIPQILEERTENKI